MTAGARVLVIDDDKDIRFLVNKTLSAAGFSVTEADSGERAIALFTEVVPDIVFLDLTMPKMDGFETSSKLRALPGGAETPIAFFTAHGSLDSYKKAMEHGPNDFITKPVSRAELILRANALLKLKRMADELRQQSQAEQQRRELLDSIHQRLGVPIADIQANARAILGHGGADPDLQAMARDIIKAAESLDKTVEGLLQRAASPRGAKR